MTKATVGDYIALDWYDGPILEIASVDFANRDRMIQVQALCTMHDDDFGPEGLRPRGTVSGQEPWRRAVIRFTREDLRAMLDLIDGKPVMDCTDSCEPKTEHGATP